jgi:enoyl-CoA hydratase
MSVVEYVVADRVARITLNRPERGNGINRELITELEDCVWGSPTTSLWAYRLGAQRAKRLLFCGDSLSGTEALEWGLAIEAPPASELDGRAEALVARIARTPVNQLRMMKLLVNESLHAQGLHAVQTLGTLLDGAARHTPAGHAFQTLAAREGFKAAVKTRDAPFAAGS